MNGRKLVGKVLWQNAKDSLTGRMQHPRIARYGCVQRAGVVPYTERTLVADNLEAIEEKARPFVRGEAHVVAHEASFDVVWIRGEEMEFALNDRHGLCAERRRRNGASDFRCVRGVSKHLVQVRRSDRESEFACGVLSLS